MLYWLTLLYYPVYFIFYLIKWVVFFLIYPVSYAFRHKITEKIRRVYNDTDGHPIRLPDGLISKHPILFFLWLALDDSVWFSHKTEYHLGYMPKWVDNCKINLLKSWWWAGLRNNAVNFSRLIAVAHYKGVKKTLIGKAGGMNRLEVREYGQFPYYLPKFQFFIPGTTHIRVKAGWQTNGRFESRISDETEKWRKYV